MKYRMRLFFYALCQRTRRIKPWCGQRGCRDRISWWQYILHARCALHRHGLVKEEE